MSINLLDLRPARNLEWEKGEDGLVAVLVPKFRNRYVVKWFVPMLAKPTIRVKLDARGSYVWTRCDGRATVGEIGKAMAAEFGEPLDAAYDRLAKFVQQLARNKFVLLSTVN